MDWEMESDAGNTDETNEDEGITLDMVGAMVDSSPLVKSETVCVPEAELTPD